jgi:hypothetical protein
VVFSKRVRLSSRHLLSEPVPKFTVRNEVMNRKFNETFIAGNAALWDEYWSVTVLSIVFEWHA